jgi:hypothetical protein
MAIIQSGVTTDLLTVEPNFKAARASIRPTEYGSLGHYRIAVTSGTIAAALAAGTGTAGHVFAFRWGDATRLAVITRIRLQFQALTAFTAAQVVDFGFDAFMLTVYSASHTAQTAITSPSKMKTSMGASLVTDIRISNTGALTAGTHTFDARPFAASVGDQQRVNPAAATEEQRVNDPTLVFSADSAKGEHPLVLVQNEGFVIRNRTVWPAAGTGVIQVEVAWAEVAAY